LRLAGVGKPNQDPDVVAEVVDRLVGRGTGKDDGGRDVADVEVDFVVAGS